MVRHIVAWRFKPELTEQQRNEAAQTAKARLEALVGVVDGLRQLHVYRTWPATSTHDLVLDSLLEDYAALAAYQVHPAHVAAGGYVREVTCDRICLDLPVGPEGN